MARALRKFRDAVQHPEVVLSHLLSRPTHELRFPSSIDKFWSVNADLEKNSTAPSLVAHAVAHVYAQASEVGSDHVPIFAKVPLALKEQV